MILLICAIVTVILITCFTENDSFGWSLTTFLAFLAVVFFLDKSISWNDVLTFLRENTGKIIACALLYIGLGIFWAIMKWKWYCRDKYAYWAKDRGFTILDVVHASDNKARITGWMLWWPMSMSWFLIHDPITKFYNFLYRKLAGVFNSISQTERANISRQEIKQKL